VARNLPPAPGLFDRVEPRVLTVGELTAQIKAAIEPRFRDVWVSGEVANLRRQSSGHVYFTLKDADATLDAVLWASQVRRVRFAVEEGVEVVARGRVDLWPPRGRYQLVVQELEPRGAGARALALEQLKGRLAAEGLLAEERKRPLPFLPRRIGVATSPTGAALGDFLRVLHGRFPGVDVALAPCRVQGEGAAATVVSALRLLWDAGVDVIVVTRGGGSAEDLWEFNDERLARAVAGSPVPVVSAVGHEVDVTVADLVADARAATPSHAAQLVVPARDELVSALSALRGRLRRAEGELLGRRRRELRALKAELADPRRALSDERRRLEDLLHRAASAAHGRCRLARARLGAAADALRRREPRAHLRELRARAEASRRRLEAWSSAWLRRECMRVERLSSRLEPANVAKILSRGFALALRDGRVVRRSAEAATGDLIRLVLGEGWLDATVGAADAGSDPLPGRGPGSTGPPRGDA